jgi:transcriptional regulator with XRE-family HTH domain
MQNIFSTNPITIILFMKKEEFVQKVGHNIRNIREERKITLEKLALEAGIEYSQLSRIEKGKINTSIYSMYNIANALEVSVTEIFLIIP